MTIKEALVWGKSRLRLAKTSEVDASALVLLAAAVGLTRADILANLERKLGLVQFLKYRCYIRRRQKSQPVWQIIGKVEFCGISLRVNKNVLTPRPETEMLVERAIAEVKKYSGTIKILDVATGSGAIAIAIAKAFPKTWVTASDISRKALCLARKNAHLNQTKNVQFKYSDLAKAVKGQFQVITANLPYLTEAEMKALPPEVSHYEPRLALYGGPDGLDLYRTLIKQLPGIIASDGVVLCEIGEGQGSGFKKIVSKTWPKARVEIVADLAGIDRIAIIEVRGG